MKRVAILGGGPAGAYAAERLARAGLRTTLFDEKLAWEKPCGGGLTYKAYNRYPFLIENDTPKKLIHDTALAGPRNSTYKMRLARPLVVYSRRDLNGMLLGRAEHAGAQIEKTRVLGMERSSDGWRIRTKAGQTEADFCIVATGARNPLRSMGTRWTAANRMFALGYYIPSSQTHIDIQFLHDLEGYIWVFPRCGHLSVGICGKGEPASALRQRLERYLEGRGISLRDSRFYGHPIPSLGPVGWTQNRLSGERWMAVGDAGGLVDPITGEGLYYAIRSADLASEVLIGDIRRPNEAHLVYSSAIERDFGADLAYGARLAQHLFRGRFLGAAVPDRMVQIIRRSPWTLDLVQDIFAGTQPYLGMRSRLLQSVRGTFMDLMGAFFIRRLLSCEAGGH